MGYSKLNEIRAEMGLEATTANSADFGYWAPCVRKVKMDCTVCIILSFVLEQ